MLKAIQTEWLTASPVDDPGHLISIFIGPDTEDIPTSGPFWPQGMWY